MYRSKRNVKIGGKVYYTSEVYSELPSILQHEFYEVEVDEKTEEVESEPKPKKKRRK